ncbi:histidine kinase [Leptobacterium flavescens]|uniref:Histidine kinase n=1 Tax=Leptobacterium flavescens TaxID=472055 RepID=A0A6P0UNS9_9FLAO|nr:histidine kinase [Leptobacterium flavescens]NER13568.1 histidine kinase [Leptobacterium flavescens]
MNKLFIHNPLFRILSPLCSGILVYLLILLINNNVGQLKEEFLGQELYVCIGLAYLIQEYSRLSLFFFERIKQPRSFALKIVLQALLSVIVCISLVSVDMYAYFKWVLGFTPSFSELAVFNIIFSIFTLIYFILYLSHQFLYKTNTQKMEQELQARDAVEKDFHQFKRGINPTLLFESLESLIVLMKKDKDAAELLVDHFSAVYRYILSKKTRELLPLGEELKILNEFLLLFGHLPYRKLRMGKIAVMDTLIVPGAVLFSIEQIIRSTIASETELVLELKEEEDHFLLCYEPQEKIVYSLDDDKLKELADTYRYYTEKEVGVGEADPLKYIRIPKLKIDEGSNH